MTQCWECVEFGRRVKRVNPAYHYFLPVACASIKKKEKKIAFDSREMGGGVQEYIQMLV